MEGALGSVYGYIRVFAVVDENRFTGPPGEGWGVGVLVLSAHDRVAWSGVQCTDKKKK